MATYVDPNQIKKKNPLAPEATTNYVGTNPAVSDVPASPSAPPNQLGMPGYDPSKEVSPYPPPPPTDTGAPPPPPPGQPVGGIPPNQPGTTPQLPPGSLPLGGVPGFPSPIPEQPPVPGAVPGQPGGPPGPWQPPAGWTRIPGGGWQPPSAAGAPPGSAPGGTPTMGNPFTDQVKARVLELMNQRPEDVNANTPGVKGQVDAYRTGQQRALERARAQSAEVNAAEGGARGAIEPGISALSQAQGESEGAFTSNLIAQQLQAQRGEVQQMLQLAAAMGNQEAQLQLTEKLATIDNSLKKYLGEKQIGVQEKGLEYNKQLGQDELALRKLLGEGGLGVQNRGLDIQQLLGLKNLDLQRFLGEGQLGLGLFNGLSGNLNFLDRLGFDYSQLQALLNQRAVETAMGR